MESFAETFDLCAGIRGILDGYPASNAILRELIQNSDDAGSRRQTFILDERHHPTGSLVVEGLASCQGPALIATNDSIFRPQDWEAIRTIHASSKADDNTMVGKYGLGFRSSYHVTDFPQILSSRTLVVFDPHRTVLSDGGIRHTSFLPAASNHQDQLAAFSSVVAADCSDFNGTVIRLPLRTKDSPQKISGFMPSIDWVKTLFSDFAEEECGIEMLFLKSLETIELVHIDPRGNRKQLSVSRIVNADEALRAKRKWTVQAGPAIQNYRLRIEATAQGRTSQSTAWQILHHFASETEVVSALQSMLGQPSKRDLKDQLKKDKLFAHAACAFPVDRAIADAAGSHGRLFTLLPLPILTGFPLHVHGIFALTPTRQSLKNPQETGLAGRDKMLVAWNQIMFQTVVPAAWAQLLNVLSVEQSATDIYTLWPDSKASRDTYWEDMSACILRVSLRQSLRIWPVHAAAQPTFVDLPSALVTAPARDAPTFDLLRILNVLGITIVAPPADLYGILPSNSFQSLRAKAVYEHIKKFSGVLNRLDSDEKRALAEYLVTPQGSIDCILGLELVPLHDGTFSAVRTGSPGNSDSLILCLDSEIALFDNYGRSLAAVDKMGPYFRRALEQASLQQRGRYNVTRLTPSIVHGFLVALTSNIPPDEDESEQISARMPWIHDFWAWVESWSESTQLFPLIRDIHLLPTRKETVRTVASGVLVCEPRFLRTIAGQALQDLGVPYLHDGAAVYTATLKRVACTRSPIDLRFLLSHIDVPKCAGLSSQHKEALKRHIAAVVTSSAVQLDPALRSRLAALPIFSVVRTHVLKNGTAKRSVELGPAIGSAMFVGQDVSIVPQLAQETFVDSADLIFRSALQAGTCLDEISLLERVAPQLDTQSSDLLDHLLHRILCRWTDLSPAARSCVQGRKALPVNADGSKRLPLCEAIDPAADIALLFSSSEDVFPTRRFASRGPWYSLLAAAGVLQSRMTQAIVHDRIRHFNAHGPDNSALQLLSLTDRHYAEHPSTKWTFPLDVDFLPHPQQKGRMCSLRGCRDNKDGHLFDLVLPVVSMRRPLTQSLRTALGWTSDVPFEVILQQVSRIMECEPTRRITHAERLIKIIQSLAPRLPSIPAGVLNAFREVTDDQEWIPIDRTTLCKTARVTLDIDLGPFRRLPSALRDSQKFPFLEAMGCTRRPTLRALISELRLLGSQSESIELALSILKEVAAHHELDTGARAELLIPDTSGTMRAPDDVFFNNVPGSSIDLASQFTLCHPGLSSDVAGRLNLRRLSDLFASRAEEEEEEEVDFGEDLYDRIRGVLRDYSHDFAFTEFIANANDAKATVFKALLDETMQPFVTALSPELAECQALPTLLLYNNAVFSEADFLRIRRFGNTKETMAEHAIGQFGLGALNFYHFTDVAMVVSGEFVLFIDPSKEYIPQKHRTAKRATLKYKLSVLNRTSPQHLSRLNGLFGFSQASESFPGTIIVLPLRSAARATTGLLSKTALGVVEIHSLLLAQYRNFAHDSLFCTTLLEIRAQRRHADGGISDLWEITADRPHVVAGSRLCHISLRSHSVRQQVASVESWYTETTTVSREHVPADLVHLVRKDKFDVTLIASARPPDQSRIFSTVPMPVQTGLPIHVSAPFVMASDRRTIRFEPPDANGRRPAGSAFNSWLLENIVPPVYLDLLEHLGETLMQAPHSRAEHLWDWFPRLGRDVIAHAVAAAFYKALPHSRHKILPAASGILAPPHASVLCRDSSYQSCDGLLYRLRPDDLFSPSSGRLLTSPAFDEMITISPDYTRRMLLEKQHMLPQLLDEQRTRSSMIHADPTSRDGVATLLRSVESTLAYLLSSQVTLDGLRILPLENGELGMLGGPVVFYSYSTPIAIPNSFSKARFIDRRLSADIQERLVRAVPNVRTINTPQSARDLFAEECSLRPIQGVVEVNEDVHHCIDAFWKDIEYFRIRDISISMLADLPLLRTGTGHRYVSLEICRQGLALFSPNDSYLDDIVDDLRRSGIIFCHHSVRRVIPTTEHATLEFSLPNVLKGLSRLSGVVEVFRTMQRPDRFAAWVRDNLTTSRQPLPDVHKLPIWVAYGSGGRQTLMAAEDLYMLPQTWSTRQSLTLLSQFLPTAVFCVGWDYMLDQLLQRHRKLDMAQTFAMLTFPAHVHHDQLPHYHALIEILRSSNFTSTSGKAIIPDGALVVRTAQSLYDHRIPLFATAFQSTPESVFAHRSLHDLMDFLVMLGLKSAVNIETFVAAARAIDADSGAPSPELVTRADVVVDSFMNDVPQSLNRSTSNRWYEVQSLCFVPTTTGGVQGLTFETSGYLPISDAVVSPSEIVRPEFETIAWTQCARLPRRLAPPPGVISAFPDFGKPSVATVVAHLKTLATVVAMGHSGNMSLLICIRDTYQWLNNCSSQAKAYIASMRGLPLFLNIDSARDTWCFRPASQLAIGLLYDAENLFCVKEWLLPYKDLLLAAGATSIAHVDYRPPAAAPGSAAARLAVLDSMRRSKELTDYAFVSETGTEHPAHKVVLASASPHHREGFSGEWSASGVQPLDETDFCIESVLSYLYVGRVERPTLQTNEEAGEILRELLDLLRLADMWTLPGLKDEVATIIAADLKLVGPTTVYEIAREAESCHADGLKSHCDAFIAKNRTALSLLND